MCIRTVLAAVLTALAPAATAFADDTPAAVLRDLPDNAWVELKTLGQPFKRNYSGMTFDTDRGVVVMWGGGHGSHPGNEVEEFDPATGRWTQPYPMMMPPWPIRWAGAYLGVDPRGFPFAWHTYHDLLYDPAAKRVLLLASGGREVWTYDPANPRWTLVNPNGPTGMLAAACAYDSDRRQVLVVSRGAFLYNPATNAFKRIATGPNPYNAAACYDPTNKRYIFFGGPGTWTYEPATDTWQKMEPAGSPPGRANHGLVFDTANGVAILFGGTWEGKTANDTWVYDLKANTWTEMKPAAAPPWKDASFYGQLVYDPGRNAAIAVWGHEWRGRCQTWAYRYKRRAKEAAFTSPSQGEVAPRGAGEGPGVAPHPDPLSRGERETRAATAPLRGTWTRLVAEDPPTAPMRRWLSGAVYDGANDRVLSFGGGFENYTARPGSVVEAFDPEAKTWATDRAVRAAEPAGAPPAQFTFTCLAFDTRKGAMVYPRFGGHPDIRQTWTYDARTKTWTEMNPKTQPPLIESASAAVYHEAARLTIAFGGTYGAGPATWAYDSDKDEWRDLRPAHSPSARMWHALAYDARRQVVVLFGGWSGADDLDDTWEFDPKTNDWREIACAARPPSRSGHGMTGDPKTGRVLLFGGNRGALRNDTLEERLYHRQSYYGGTNLNDTWALDPDGRSWRPVECPAAPPACTVFGGFVFDAKRSQAILIDPKKSKKESDTSTTWALRLE